MTSFVQVITTPTADTASGGLLLHFDHRRYFFGNVAQGTQRAFTQRGLSLTKLEKLFLCGPINWQNVGGLMGMMLTVADALGSVTKETQTANKARREAGKPELPIAEKSLQMFGSKNLAYALATSRNFIFRTGMPIKALEFDVDPRIATPTVDPEKPDWEDDSIRVWHLLVSPDSAANGMPTASKKRTFDMMAEAESGGVGSTAAAAQDEQQKSDSKYIHEVLDSMFNSNWRPDSLVESKLHDVHLPATIFVRRDDGAIQRYQGPMPDKNPDAPNIDVLVRKPWPGIHFTTLPPVSPSPTSLCYIVKNKGRRGKFNAKAAKQLGVKPQDNKLLTNGQTVKGKDGIDVTPDMVMEAPVKGSGFALIELPSRDYVQAFLDRPEWESEGLMDQIYGFYWILGEAVFDDPAIQAFIKARPDVKHVVMAPDISPNQLAYESYAALLTKLRRIDPERFHVPKFDNKYRDVSSTGANVEVARTGMKSKYLPNFQVIDDEVVPFARLDEALNMDEEIISLAKEAKRKVADPAFQAAVEQSEQDIPNRDAEVIPLGTGSAQPSKYRNVSSNLVRVPGVGNYLFDAGENTIGQLKRMFSEEEFKDVVSNLRLVLISHMHADHHLGVADVIGQWHRLTIAQGKPDATLTVCSPEHMQQWLKEYSHVEDIGLSRLQFSINKGRRDEGAHITAAGLQHVNTTFVEHCHGATAAVLTWPSGLKVAYSGDCRPSPKFAAIGKGATLLIHECTFDDDKVSDAKEKKHSTMGEALDIAAQMGARRVLLTHFSQRYAKFPLLEQREVVTEEEEDGKDAAVQDHVKKVQDQVVLMAFDQMRVKLGEFKHAAAFFPALKLFFDKESES